ncbi:MAG: DUF1048 domain-containing protein [Pseudolysinimonas sp.]|uniref:DUF1048 domain-containing protein n=1 Tax=Pseudolysinimonas sp. TaxID=2680009 RepID=UPI0032671556
MAKNPIELVTGSLKDKKQWRVYRARIKQLPASYRATVGAIEKYLWNFGETPTEWPRAAAMLDGLADLFERAATDGTPIRDIVGDDPADFAETFARSYSDGGWIAKARARLVQAVDDAAREDGDS